jgi:vacuolar protein 8
MDSSSPKVQCQAALALRNLASDEKYQLDIVRANGLQPLLRLLQSSYLPLILSAVACIRNISIHPMNESPIIEANFLKPLVDLLGSTDNEEIQCHAISTLRNLAASSDRNKALVLDAGAVQKCKQLVLDVPVTVQSEMTAAIAVLALSDDLKSHLLNLGVCDVLIPLTHSPSIEVQGNSAAALGNLSSKGMQIHVVESILLTCKYSRRVFHLRPKLEGAQRRNSRLPLPILAIRGRDFPAYCSVDTAAAL